MGKPAVPQANPGRDETVGSGTEKRSGWRCSSLYRLFLHRRCYPLCKTRTTCPKKRPIEGHSCWFLRWGVCYVPMIRSTSRGHAAVSRANGKAGGGRAQGVLVRPCNTLVKAVRYVGAALGQPL